MSTVLPDAIAEGRFQLLEVIGEGGMATVYRAFDQRLQRPRAIKVLSPALAGRPQLRRRFLHEAQTMATLEESRVVRVFDMGEDGERVYIVMELVDGGSLLDRVRDHGPLPPRLAASVGLQICESLQAAHDASVIHRDIKPHNILLTRAGEIRITDFGIAQVQQEGGDGLTKTGAVMGTWGFMAPEQKSNAKNVDSRADLYSVGATLWSLLRGDTPPELFMADAEPHMLEGIPDALAEVIRRATRYRREDRYPTVRAMADSIRALMPLLPEDPEGSAPLVMPTTAFSRPPADTIDQFRTPAPQPAVGTMVPDMAELPPPVAPRHMPIPNLGRPSAPATGVDLSFSTEARDVPAPGNRHVWAGAVGALGLGLAALLVFTLGGPGADSPETQAEPVGNIVATGPDAILDTPPLATPPGTPVLSGTPPLTVADTTPILTAAGTAPASAPLSTSVPIRTSTTGVEGATGTAAIATNPDVPPGDPSLVPDASVLTTVAAVEPVEDKPIPRVAPKLVHSSPEGGKVGDVLTFSAKLASGWQVKLYYRPDSGGAFREKAMSGSGDTYSTSLKIDESMATGLDYFLSATDDRTTIKEGAPSKPLHVAVTP